MISHNRGSKVARLANFPAGLITSDESPNRLPATSTIFLSLGLPPRFYISEVREGFTKKVAVILEFVQFTSTPPTPSPQFGQLVPLFFNANVPKNLGRTLPPLIWTKSKRTATFFRETFRKVKQIIVYATISSPKVHTI